LCTERPCLNYNILLLGVKGPSEERMEAAFFKPPLSKQRVEYALKHIRESSASTLVSSIYLNVFLLTRIMNSRLC